MVTLNRTWNKASHTKKVLQELPVGANVALSDAQKQNKGHTN